MDKRPEIIALQADPGGHIEAHRALAAALADWRAQAEVGRVLEDLRRFGAGEPLASLADLAALFGEEAGVARRIAGSLASNLAGALAREPLGIVPLRHFTDGVVSNLLLAHEGEAHLTLVAIDGKGLAQCPRVEAASFGPGEEWEVVIAGHGRGRLVERRGARIRAHEIALHPGLALGREAHSEALLFDAVDGLLLVLRLQRRPESPVPKREYAISDSRLLRQACATPRESRHEVAVALLGRMGRRDAAPLLGEIAQDRSHGDSLRWQALRECLGLDTRTGYWTLTAIARAGSDPLAIPAGALRAQLLETYPQLDEVELCPA